MELNADLKAEADKTDQLLKQEEAMKEILDAQKYETERISQNMLIQEEKQSEIKELEAAKKGILGEVGQKEEDLVELNEKMMEQEKEKQDEIKQKMIDYAVSQEKDIEPIKCISPSLGTDQKEEHIRVSCASFLESDVVPDFQDITNCLRTDKFCGVCCGFHIG